MASNGLKFATLGSTTNFISFQGNLGLPSNEASNSLKISGLHFLTFFFLFVATFSNFTSGMDYILLEDLQKVYFRGGSLEARWTSNGGHNI